MTHLSAVRAYTQFIQILLRLIFKVRLILSTDPATGRPAAFLFKKNARPVLFSIPTENDGERSQTGRSSPMTAAAVRRVCCLKSCGLSAGRI